MPSPLPAGLLFDLDGTLVETDPTHLAAFNDILGPYGITVDEHFYNANIIGFPNADIFMRILPALTVADHMRLADEKEALFRSRAGGLKPAHGLLDLLDRADASGVATIVVTNAPRANALMMLGALGITDRFRGMIIGDEMANPKPHPEPYLVGLERLGASTDHAVAFEELKVGCPLGRRRRAERGGHVDLARRRSPQGGGSPHRGARFHRSRPDLARARTDRYGLTP